MNQVLEQSPQARKQARQRILQGQAVPNEEKILSLQEPAPQGLILDWELFRQSAPADLQRAVPARSPAAKGA